MRKVHLSVSLFLLIPLIVYAISAVDFAHRRWLPHPHGTKEETRRFAPGITDARVLAREWHGELALVENSPGYLKFRVMSSLGGSHEVAYSIASGDATIRTNSVGLFTTLAYIHVAHGLWVFAAMLFSLGLLTLGATGIYLWFQRRRDRRIGLALLLLGTGIPLALIVSMRMSP